MSWLWAELHDLFDTDDGSLPEIRLDYRRKGSAARAFDVMRRRAARVSPELSAAHLDGEFEPVHVILSGIECRGVGLPELGAFVFPDQLAIDYRMGGEWSASRVEALFELLRELAAVENSPPITLHPAPEPEAVSRFEQAWARWEQEAVSRRGRATLSWLSLIPDGLRDRALEIERPGNIELAWDADAVLEVISILEKEAVVILGGDAYRLTASGSLEPLYENWCSEPVDGEPAEAHVRRAADESRRFVTRSRSQGEWWYVLVPASD